MSQPPEPHVRRGRGRGRGTSRGSPSPSGYPEREDKLRTGSSPDPLTHSESTSTGRERRPHGARERKKPEVQIYVPRARRLHQQGDGKGTEVNGDVPSQTEERLHKHQDDPSSRGHGRESLGSPSEQRRTKSGRKTRPEMQRYVPRARRQPVPDSNSSMERSVVPESWEEATEMPVDEPLTSIPENTVDSPKHSSVKKFKSETAISDETDNAGLGDSASNVEAVDTEARRPSLERQDIQSNSQIVSHMDAIPSSTSTLLPDLIQGTVSACARCRTCPDEGSAHPDPAAIDASCRTCPDEGSAHPDPAAIDARCIQDSDNNNLNDFEADSSFASDQQCRDLDSVNLSHQTVHVSSVNIDGAPVSLGQQDPGDVAGTEADTSTPEPFAMEEDFKTDVVSVIPDTGTEADTSTPEPFAMEEDFKSDVVSVIPDTVHDSQDQDNVESLTSPSVQDENILKECDSATVVGVSDEAGETIDPVLDREISPDTQQSVEEHDQSAPADSGSGGEERMEEENSQSHQMDGVTLKPDNSSPSTISDNKTVSDEDDNSDLKTDHAMKDSEGSICVTENEIVDDPIQAFLEAGGGRDLDSQSLELERKLKAQAIAALDFSEPTTGSQEDEEDEDSWDKMFDDNGDCLDPSQIEELTAHVGKVQIDKPKIDYLQFQPKEPDIDMALYGHIVEIHDFPAEFLTRDIIGAFKDFLSKGFDIKWVDDTHALGVFASTIAANDALRMNHPFLKTRSLTDASKQSKAKAKKNHEFLQPYKARPETSASAARRLVSASLGLQAQIPREKRELERKQLKEAKEKRRKDRRLKQDMWDGSVGQCAMDQKDEHPQVPSVSQYGQCAMDQEG